MNLDFIQIGAHIGNNDDFVAQNIENKNFSTGILIEANPKAFKILKNKFFNTNYFVENIAISSFDGKIILSVDNFEQKDHISQISSTKPNFTKNHPWGINANITEIEVSCETLQTLWGRYNLEHVKYLCIDTEGSDFDILINTDFNNLNIDNIYFEHMHTDGVHTTGNNYEILKEYLFQFGYKNIETFGGNTLMSKYK